MSVRLGRFMERSGLLPTTQFADRKRLGTCDALFCVSHTLQSLLDTWQEARIVHIDFSAASDKVNHQGILYKLCSVGIGVFVVVVVAVVVVVGQTVGSISSKTLAYDCLYTLELCTASLIATS